MKKFKTPISLFLFFLFVLPLINKEVHNHAHANDLRCVSSTTHLHELEHNCSFCDFNGPITETALYFQSIFIISTIEVTFTVPLQKFVASYTGSILKGRAPPIC